ncbi:MAG: hypothetical protein JXB32_21585 [Deltaproteobacteria bacterium]|nr:hypothetical protein [Deltaproteobacteria bacterium]
MTPAELLDLATAGRTDELRQALAAAAPSAAEALVGALAERSRADLLAELDVAPVPPAVRKRVRAALHLLRARGVRPPASTRVARLAPAAAAEGESATAEAWLAVPRPSLHLVLVPRDASGRRLLVAILDEQERVVEGGRSPHATARAVRELVERGSVGDAPFVPLPAGHAAQRLRAAVRRPPSPHGPEAAGARTELVEALAMEEALADAPHPAWALAPPEPDSRARAAAGLAFGLHDLPFALDKRTLDTLLERLNAARVSPLVLAPELAAEREAAVVRTLVERELPPDLVAGLGLRLLDRAWVRRTREPEAARSSAAAGALLLERPASPEARELLRAFVSAHLRPPEEVGRGEPGAAAERRSGGGLILP